MSSDPSGWSSRLDNPVLVQWEYASEERLRTRNALYQGLLGEGENAEQMIHEAVAEVAPRRVLDVGCGTGEIGARIVRELGAEVLAVDLSPRMVDLAREKGLEARLADIEELPYADGEFDCVVAAWVIYHAPDRDRAIRECARVLRPGGRLVAATIAEDNLAEVWELLGQDWHRRIDFDRDNGAAQLAPHFAHVERRDANGTVVFPDSASIRKMVAASMTRAHLSGSVPEISEPFSAGARHTVFVADKA
jgi:ubiquinone/menaquinone biosynthesis C-methylase UbiE